MSLYGQYLTERTSDKIFETEDGFATYRFVNDNKTVYIVDIFVTPEKRRDGIGTKIADEVAYLAKAHGCMEMIGSVVPSTKFSTRSLKALLAYGMTLNSSTNDFIVLRKDI